MIDIASPLRLRLDSAALVHNWHWLAQAGGAEAGAAIKADGYGLGARAVMQRLSGNDAGLAGSAAQSLALDRGSRLWTMKTALEAIGLPTRIAAVRTFSTDAGDQVLPDESLLSYVGLRVELPEGQELWLDTSTRFAPFGELPEQARGRERHIGIVVR